MAHREHALVVRTSHKIGQRRHHALAHLHLPLAAKLAVEVTPRTLGHEHHALGLKIAKEPLAQTVQALVGKARPQVGDSLLGAMQRRGVGVVGLDATRSQEHASARRLLAAQLRERRITPALNNALEVKYRLSMTDQIQIFIHRGVLSLVTNQGAKTPHHNSQNEARRRCRAVLPRRPHTQETPGRQSHGKRPARSRAEAGP